MLSYAPSHCDAQTLLALTVGESRKQLLADLLEAVAAEIGRKTHQHHLIIGPRGSGKSHLLALLGHRLEQDSPLKDQVLLAALAKEEVAPHPADLLIKILEECEAAMVRGASGTTDDPRYSRARSLLRSSLDRLAHESDDQGALELAADTLAETAKTLDRLIVATVENLDSLLFSGPALSRKSVAREQWGLRKALQETSGFLLIASAPTFFAEVQDPRAAFYDFFRHHTLREMSSEEIFRIMETRLELELKDESLDSEYRRRVEALADGFERRKPDIQGLLTLTGGLPRFAHFFYDLLVRTQVSGVARMLARFLDSQSPYFQTRLDPRVIPEAELAVLDALALADGPLPPKDIASRLRAASPNAVNTQLKRLKDRGLVKTLSRRPKVRYELGEVLFLSGRNEEALSEFEDARDLFEKVGDDLGRANAIRARGDLFQEKGRKDAAARDYLEALRLALGVEAAYTIRRLPLEFLACCSVTRTRI